MSGSCTTVEDLHHARIKFVDVGSDQLEVVELCAAPFVRVKIPLTWRLPSLWSKFLVTDKVVERAVGAHIEKNLGQISGGLR